MTTHETLQNRDDVAASIARDLNQNGMLAQRYNIDDDIDPIGVIREHLRRHHEYPHKDGEFVVLGPETFANADLTIISCRGENYYAQGYAPRRPWWRSRWPWKRGER